MVSLIALAAAVATASSSSAAPSPQPGAPLAQGSAVAGEPGPARPAAPVENVAAAPAAVERVPPAYGFCGFTDLRRRMHYLSGLFETSELEKPGLGREFDLFLMSRYQLAKPESTCGVRATSEVAAAVRLKTISIIQGVRGMRIVDAPWSPRRSSALEGTLPTAALSPPAPSPQSGLPAQPASSSAGAPSGEPQSNAPAAQKYAHCHGFVARRRSYYISNVFKTSASDPEAIGALMKEYDYFLISAHGASTTGGLAPSSGCWIAGSADEAEADRQKSKTAFGDVFKVVDVAWSPSDVPASFPPPAAQPSRRAPSAGSKLGEFLWSLPW